MISIKKVKGHSMEPDLNDGDYIVVLSLFLNRLRLDDWVVIQHPQFGNIVKQICGVSSEGYKVKGLSKYSTDTESLGVIRQNMIRGKVLLRIAGS